jgi:hypothetical protein
MRDNEKAVRLCVRAGRVRVYGFLALTPTPTLNQSKNQFGTTATRTNDALALQQ